jgi:hypothetical protein
MNTNSWIFNFFLCLPVVLFAQRGADQDRAYLEDQLFFSLGYTSLMDTPNQFQQNGFSYGLSLGFIKDIPFNKSRNFGMAVGAGYAYHRHNHNLLHDKNSFEVSDDYRSNFFSYNSLEIPFELRWRTSTYDKFKFWRVYSGITVSYILKNYSKYRTEQKTEVLRNLKEIEKLQYGVTLSMGYNTWNFYANYSLTSLYKEGVVNGADEVIEMKPLRLGLIFYML